MTLTPEQATLRLTQDINSVKTELIKKQDILDNFGSPTDYLKMAEKGRIQMSVSVGLPQLLARYKSTLNDPRLFKIYCENN